METSRNENRPGRSEDRAGRIGVKRVVFRRGLPLDQSGIDSQKVVHEAGKGHVANQPANDQAQYLKQLLSRLDASDRALIVGMVEALASRLSKDRTER